MSWLRGRSVRVRPLVLEARRSVAVEGVDRIGSKERLERVAVIAHWAPDGRIDRSVRELAGAMVQSNYEVLLVSTVEGVDPLEWPPDVGRITILRRPNLGYDFGSWATALDRYPAIASAESVLLLNTSLVGPFAPIDHLLKDFEESTADVWGITDSTQFGHHLQSYCLGFRRRTLGEAPLARFWRQIRVEPSRAAVIEHGELDLGRLLARERYVVDAAIPSWRVVAGDRNPTIVGWRRLLDAGFPFVKRQLLRAPEVAADAQAIAGEVRRRYGVEVEDWV